MSRKVLTTALAAFACAAVVGAQAPQTPQTPQIPAPTSPASPAQRTPEARSTSADNFTVTGCLERRTAASNAAPAPTGTAGRSEGPGFILTKVMKPTGTAGSTSAPPVAASYRLDADDAKLSEHVGKKVEIKGMLEDRSASPDASKVGSADAPRLKVDSVKMIAATCTE